MLGILADLEIVEIFKDLHGENTLKSLLVFYSTD
jgi:hypothetical protein